jgi:hydroxymethylglutaryl-CoA lyase
LAAHAACNRSLYRGARSGDGEDLGLIMAMPKAVKLVEVGARDGLQNEASLVKTGDKIAFIDLLSQSGLRWIEATSFVSPRAIPQLSDAAEVFTGIRKAAGVRYPVLVPNMKGYDRARTCGADAIAVFTAASEAFAKRNINMSVEESIAVFSDVVRRAKSDGVWVRGYVSTAFGSPFGDAVTPAMVRGVCVKLLELGCDEISVGDTIGVGVPTQVDQLVPMLAREVPLDRLAFHFHDTRGTALANLYAALQHGAHIFDSSSGGLGGCPYAPGATGNVGTEDVLYLLHGMGIETGVDLAKIRAASRYIRRVLDHELTSKAFAALEAAGA